jgi:hypothetical protein
MVTEGQRGTSLEDALKPIRRLPKGTVWRYGQAGDLPGHKNHIDANGLRQLVAANRGKAGIAFTHKPPISENLELIFAANRDGFIINLSANSPAEADQFAKTGLPVVTILSSTYQRRHLKSEWAETLVEYRKRTSKLPKHTPGGRRIAVCPATYLDVTCQQCRLCSRERRNGVIIGFPAHGTKAKAIDNTLK